MKPFLSLALLLAACITPMSGAPPTQSSRTAPASHAQSGAPARVCAANVWSGDAERSLTQKLNDADALGIRAVRHVTGESALTGGGVPRARSVADALRARGFTALLQVAPKFTSPDVTDEELFAGGAMWGRFLREYADVYPHGVQVGNEANNKIVFVQRRALRDGATEAAAAQEARVVAERMAMAVVRFAEGVRSTCSQCSVNTGGLGNLNGPRRDAAVMYLRFLAPHVASGVVAPVLDVHVYRGRQAFAREGGGRVRWRENFGAGMRALLSEAGWPAATALQSTETNVPADDGWRSAGEQAEALEALLRGLLDAPRMELVCLFSPWSENREERWLIRPNTPVGAAVREVATEDSL